MHTVIPIDDFNVLTEAGEKIVGIDSYDLDVISALLLYPLPSGALYVVDAVDIHLGMDGIKALFDLACELNGGQGGEGVKAMYGGGESFV